MHAILNDLRFAVRQTLANYFRTLDFSLGPRQVAGLREFARRAGLPVDPVFAAV